MGKKPPKETPLEGAREGGGMGAPVCEFTVGNFLVLMYQDLWMWIECLGCRSSWLIPTRHLLDVFDVEYPLGWIETEIVCHVCGNRINLDEVVTLIPEDTMPKQQGRWSLNEEFNSITAKCRDDDDGSCAKTGPFPPRCIFS